MNGVCFYIESVFLVNRALSRLGRSTRLKNLQSLIAMPLRHADRGRQFCLCLSCRDLMDVAFLDRDGTIIVDYPDIQWTRVHEPTFLEGATSALQNIRAKGFEIIIVTNQYLMNEGFITHKQYKTLARKFLSQLATAGVDILDVFYCPHARPEGCACMKPRTGMIEAACQKYPTINLGNSFLVGDSETDIQLANTMGIRAFGIGLDTEGLQCTSVTSLQEVINHL